MAEQSASITQPLLRPYPSAQGQLAEWAQDQYVGTAPRQPASVEINAVVTGQEIRSAASSDPYPPWIHGALLTVPEPLTEGAMSTLKQLAPWEDLENVQL